MRWFGDLFRRRDPPVEIEERDYSRVAVPDPHMPDGKAAYIDAWVGYSDRRMMVRPRDLHTVGREPRQVHGAYPTSEMTVVEEVEWKVAPEAIQTVRQQAPDPRWAALKKPPLRRQRAPTTYRVQNPFDWQNMDSVPGYVGYHGLNGLHFSMASNIRTYPIGGMLPMTSRRNTFRLMPPPHDVNQTNVPADIAFDVSDMDMASAPSAWRNPLARLR